MASRFWVQQPISAIADNGSGKCRCTVTSTTGMTTGDTRYFANMTGTVGLAGAQTITVINATTLDVTAVAFVATGTGGIHGAWDANNTNNWVSTTGGTNYGQTVPGTADTATFDGNSGAGSPIITVGSSIGGTNTLQSITAGVFAGTLDFSVNNPTITTTVVGGFNANGAGVKTIKFGTSTFNINAGTLDLGNANTSVTAGACTINFNHSGTFTQQQGFFISTAAGNSTAFSSATINVNGRTNGPGFTMNGNPSTTFGTMNVTGPVYWVPPLGATLTLTNFSAVGTLSQPIALNLSTAQATIGTLTITNAPTISYCILRSLIFTNAATANNSFDNGNNTNVTINNPSLGSVGVIGG